MRPESTGNVVKEARSTFKFLDQSLQQRLVKAIDKKGVRYSLSRKREIVYEGSQDERVENAICSLRRIVIRGRWKIITCPRDWIDRYVAYMTRRRIAFYVEISDGETWFLISANVEGMQQVAIR